MNVFWDSNCVAPWDCWSICYLECMLATPSNQTPEAWHRDLLRKKIPGMFKASTSFVVNKKLTNRHHSPPPAPLATPPTPRHYPTQPAISRHHSPPPVTTRHQPPLPATTRHYLPLLDTTRQLPATTYQYSPLHALLATTRHYPSPPATAPNAAATRHNFHYPPPPATPSTTRHYSTLHATTRHYPSLPATTRQYSPPPALIATNRH